jgi:hypothetical protein
MAFFPPFSLAEHIHVQVCRVAYPELSYGDLARRLNLIFRDYNGGCRTRDGVYTHIRRGRRPALVR